MELNISKYLAFTAAVEYGNAELYTIRNKPYDKRFGK